MRLSRVVKVSRHGRADGNESIAEGRTCELVDHGDVGSLFGRRLFKLGYREEEDAWVDRAQKAEDGGELGVRR